MKKLILAALFAPLVALAQSYPSPTFNNLVINGTLSGVGFNNFFASPPAIGSTTPAAGSFTNLSSTGTISGTGFSSYFASPPAIGGTAANAASFTNLSSSGTVSGTGFSTYLASPPALGGTTPNTVNATAYSSSITPSASGLTTNCNNISPGGGYCVNQINIGPNSPYETAKLSNPVDFLNGFTILHNYGAGFTGGRQTFVVQGQVVGASGASNTNHNYVGGVFTEGSQANDGGTGTTKLTAQGAVFSMNPVAVLYNGATNYLELAGAEVDIAAQTGSSVYYKTGWSIVESGTDAVQGSVYDAALSISSMTGAVGWQNGILFGPVNGQFPISSTGCLICSSGSGTAATGIDFSSLTLTNFIKGPGSFVVSGAGGVASTSLSTTGPVAVRYSSPNIAIGDTSGSASAVLFLQNNTTNVWGFQNTTSTGQFCLNRYVSGSLVDCPIAVANATGITTFADGIKGTVSGAVATAGNIGELLQNQAAGVSLTSTTSANAGTVTLTPGDWDVSCAADFSPAAGTTIASLGVSISTTSATFGGNGAKTSIGGSFTTGFGDSLATPVVPKNVSTSTPVYCVVNANFGTSTMTVTGTINARRSANTH